MEGDCFCPKSIVRRLDLLFSSFFFVAFIRNVGNLQDSGAGAALVFRRMKKPLVPIEFSIDINAPAAAVFAAYAQVSRWHEWDPDTKKASIDGPCRSGAVGRLHPAKGLPVKMRLVDVRPSECLVALCPVLGSLMRFEHHIEALPQGGVRARHRVIFSGWLAPLLDRYVGREVRKGLPITLNRLKQYVEAGHTGAGSGSIGLTSHL